MVPHSMGYIIYTLFWIGTGQQQPLAFAAHSIIRLPTLFALFARRRILVSLLQASPRLQRRFPKAVPENFSTPFLRSPATRAYSSPAQHPTSPTMSVRKSPPPAGPGMAVSKRARVEDDDESNTMTLTVASSGEGQRKNALVRTIKRTSGLEAPIVALSGAHGVSWR